MNTESDIPRLRPIVELNRLPPDEFAAALKPLFETVPPLADGLLAARPYQSYDELLARAETVIAGLTDEQKIAVVNAHPRIGERAGVVRESSALSYREQGYEVEAALDQERLNDVYRALAELNHAYEARFGFRFVVFVNGRPKSAILEVLKGRMECSRAEELATALTDMLAIARDRLGKLRVES